MPLKKNSPKWHETANRRQSLWEQFFTIRSLLFCECWGCSTTGVRNLLKACSKNPSVSLGSVFSIAIIRLPGQLIQQIDCSLPNPLTAGLTELRQELWEAAASGSVPGAAHNIPWGMRDLPAVSVHRGIQCNAKLSTASQMSLFLWPSLSFPWLWVSRALSCALWFKEQAKVLECVSGLMFAGPGSLFCLTEPSKSALASCCTLHPEEDFTFDRSSPQRR